MGRAFCQQLVIAGHWRDRALIRRQARSHGRRVGQPALGETDNPVLDETGIAPEPQSGGTHPGTFRSAATRRASTATTSALTAPTDKAAVIPAMTSEAFIDPVKEQHVNKFQDPFASPSVLRAAAQNASWARVNAPESRAWANAVEPGNAPGLILRTSR